MPFDPNVNDSITITESVSVETPGIAAIPGRVTVWIRDPNFQEVSKHIVRRSFKIENILTRQIDRAAFRMRKILKDGTTFLPKSGHEIIIYDGLTKIFAGVIVQVKNTSRAYKYIEYDIEANDYGRLLDRFLVNDTFTDQTIEQIINFIVVDKDLDSGGFTTQNVNANKIVAYVAFKYEPFSSVLTQLADLIGSDWYVDYDKDIHFFPKEETDAPFDITDGGGTMVFESLNIRKSNKQLRNVIYVRGGDYLGDAVSSRFDSDGAQNTYALPYKFDTLQLTVTGEIWEQGIDGIDNASEFDYMWNQDEKAIIFRSDRIPSTGSVFSAFGEPFLPVRVKMKDQESVDTMASAEGGVGEYEYLVIDQSIDSREGARERGSAELEAYKSTLVEGDFITYTAGLRSGQRILINSEAHDINERFIINRVTLILRTENTFEYKVSFVTTKTFGIIELLRKLLEKGTKEIIINENEVLDVVEAYDETIEIVETTVTSELIHNPQTEAFNIVETTVTAQSLNFETIFVYGPQFPSGFKRVGIYDGSLFIS